MHYYVYSFYIVIKQKITVNYLKLQSLSQVQLEHYKTHIDNCDYVQIGCMNTGCSKQVLRKNMYLHEEECMYRLMPCKKGCGLPVPAKDANSHKCVEELKQRLESKSDLLFRDLLHTNR